MVIGMDILLYIGGVLITIIGYFLKRTMTELDKMVDKVTDLNSKIIENKSRIELVDNNHNHLNEKFDQLYDAVRDLTMEIKNLSRELSKKKDM